MGRVGITRFTRIVATAALTLLAAEPALAGEMDLTIGVRTARPTTVSPMRYRLVAGGGDVLGQSPAADDGTTPVTLTLHVVTPAACILYTPFGEFGFSVAEGGAISVPAGSPLSVSGSTLTIDNGIDLSDFGVRMRKPTTLKRIELRPWSDVNWRVQSPLAPSAGYLDGAQADTAVRWPLLGLVSGTRVRVASTLGASFWAVVTATAGLAIDPDPAALPVSVDGADPQVLVIENTIDMPDFAIRLAKPTTAKRVWYRIKTSWQSFAHFPGPEGLDVLPFEPGLTYYPGPTAHSETVAFPLVGLAPNETIEVGSVFGGETFRVTAGGSLQQLTAGSRIAFDGDTALVQNLLDIPFRVRLQRPVNAELVHMVVGIYSTPGNAIPMSEIHPRSIAGSDADDGIAFPLMGIVPGMTFFARTPIAGDFYLIPTEDGRLEIDNPVSPPAGEVVEVGGEQHLVIFNPISVRCRIYGESPVPSLGTNGILLTVYFGDWAPSPIDPEPGGVYPPSRACDGEDWPTGVQFLLDGMGPYTKLHTNGGFGWGQPTGYWFPAVPFRLNLDGTATFLSPARTLTPWKGAIDIDANHDGALDNIYYVEIAPLNNAPTATLSTGNFTIPTTAQSSTVVSAQVGDADGGTLTCRWYVDGALVLEQVVASGGTTALDLGALDSLGVGAHVVRLVASDGELAAMPEVVMTLENSPPEVVAGGGGVYELGPGSAVTLTGTVADFDGDELSYKWLRGDGTVLAEGTVAAPPGGGPVAVPECTVGTDTLGLGMHVLTLSVEDQPNAPVLATALVQVKDTTGPTLAPTSSHRLLWPPNHEMVDVTVMANAVDVSGGPLTYTVTVESSEPPEFDGAGNFEPDHEVVSIDPATGELHLRLRAERSGQGDGRVYTIVVTATDASGNQSTATFEVKAPHDKGRK